MSKWVCLADHRFLQSCTSFSALKDLMIYLVKEKKMEQL